MQSFQGRWHEAAQARYIAAVLEAQAAQGTERPFKRLRFADEAPTSRSGTPDAFLQEAAAQQEPQRLPTPPPEDMRPVDPRTGQPPEPGAYTRLMQQQGFGLRPPMPRGEAQPGRGPHHPSADQHAGPRPPVPAADVSAHIVPVNPRQHFAQGAAPPTDPRLRSEQPAASTSAPQPSDQGQAAAPPQGQMDLSQVLALLEAQGGLNLQLVPALQAAARPAATPYHIQYPPVHQQQQQQQQQQRSAQPTGPGPQQPRPMQSNTMLGLSVESLQAILQAVQPPTLQHPPTHQVRKCSLGPVLDDSGFLKVPWHWHASRPPGFRNRRYHTISIRICLPM